MVAVLGLVIGLLVFIIGIIILKYPYRFARINEQIDAIGSKRRLNEVEPADWNVGIAKVIGVTLTAIGSVVLFLSLLD